jgi:pimeloyl-ACP methyl ester carboxylesterase
MLSRRDFVASAFVASAFASRLGGQSRNAVAATLDRSPDAVLARRKEALRILQEVYGNAAALPRGQRLNVLGETWEKWQQRTGELPPDFDGMPSMAFLPDPLLTDRGTKITSLAQWKERKTSLRKQFQQWWFGTFPPAPGNVRGIVTAERKEGDVTVQDIRLEFGPDHKATMQAQLLIPPGKGPFPVLLTNHPRRRPWVNTAVRRGYIGCVINAADTAYIPVDDTNAWVDIYPEYDWSLIARWSWGVSRAVDYLLTRPEVIKTQIIVGGHSRNSKSSLIATAFDERIAAVIPSRGNTADGNPFRFSSPVYISESLEEITNGLPHWFHPRLRFFCGREHKLPVDSNLLMALVAPRPIILSHAYTEHQGNVIAIEQAYRSVRSVYRFLGAEDKIGLYQMPGEHASSAEDIEQYFDFMDARFGRKPARRLETWVLGYSFADWQKRSGVVIDPLAYKVRTTGDFLLDPGGKPIATLEDWPKRRTEILRQLRWSMGEQPPGTLYYPERDRLGQGGLTDGGFQRQLLPGSVEGLPGQKFSFGDDLSGEVYLPVGFQAARGQGGGGGQNAANPAPLPVKYPVVVWMHPYSYAMGYARYAFWAPLVRAGFVVACFDQIGFGSRGVHSSKFYERYPKWSLMGKMVADTSAMVDNLARLREVDASRIYLMGWSLGAKVALRTAALNDQVAGVGLACGISPLRGGNANNETEGVQHYSHIHGLLPKLGYFVGHESRLPVDYDELLAAVAPRPVYLHAPTLDRYNPLDSVRKAVEPVKRIYELHDRPENLIVKTPVDFSRFENDQQAPVYAWLAKTAGLPAA